MIASYLHNASDITSDGKLLIFATEMDCCAIRTFELYLETIELATLTLCIIVLENVSFLYIDIENIKLLMLDWILVHGERGGRKYGRRRMAEAIIKESVGYQFHGGNFKAFKKS